MRAIALAPGVVRTRLAIEGEVGADIPTNTAALPAATTLYLTSGRADWLSGRSVDQLYSARLILTCRQVLLHELGHRGGGTRLEGSDPRAERAHK